MANRSNDGEAAALLDIGTEIAHIRELVRVHISGRDRRASYEAAADAIEERARDPPALRRGRRRVSSGKSTFINAMPRQPLLRTSRLPTTAAVTRIEAGPQLSVTVRFRDTNKSVRATQTALYALRNELHRRGNQTAQQASLEQIIQSLTSDPAVARDVSDVVFAVPSRQLEKRLVILDTPGINAGADQAARGGDENRDERDG